MALSQRKIISISAGVGAFIVAALLIGFLSNQLAHKSQFANSVFPGLNTVSFNLPATTGGKVSNEDLLGRPTAVFYGFTHCPEVCPATLYGLSQIVESIGAAANDLQIVFVTVDPERDSVAILKEYIGAINEDAIGLSGSPEAIDTMRKAFGIFAEKTLLDDGDYTIDHTATVFLYDAQGALSGTIAWGEADDFAEAKLRGLLEKS